MELSRQTYHFICFELLRLRTRYDNEKDNTVKVRIAKRYREVRKEFDSRGSQWIPSEHELDRIINTVEIIEKERKYSKKQCMRCKKAPEVEALWAEGMGHVWFCKEHYEEWKKDEFELNGKMLTYGSEVNTERKINGEASEKWSEPVKKEELKKEEEKSKDETKCTKCS